jgi:ABC-type sugar transport system ATPase subunit
MSTLRLNSLNKTYPNGQWAVRDVDLTIDDGELFVIVGPSGGGKTTLLRMVAGLEDVTSGEIVVDGVRINDVPPNRRDIAMAFQSYALYPHMTVAENIGSRCGSTVSM